MIEEFGFQHDGHSFRVTLSGGVISKEGPPQRGTVKWNIQRDDGRIFTIDPKPWETKESIKAEFVERYAKP